MSRMSKRVRLNCNTGIERASERARGRERAEHWLTHIRITMFSHLILSIYRLNASHTRFIFPSSSRALHKIHWLLAAAHSERSTLFCERTLFSYFAIATTTAAAYYCCCCCLVQFLFRRSLCLYSFWIQNEYNIRVIRMVYITNIFADSFWLWMQRAAERTTA